MVDTTAAYHDAPMSSSTMAMVRSAVVDALMSPYPTVDRVVTE